MKSRLKPMPVLGYTTRKHLLLDLDSKKLDYIHYIIRLVMERWNKVGDALILVSSKGTQEEELQYSRKGRVLRVRHLDSYHIVFDNVIGYNLCCKIIQYLAELGILNRDYVQIRQFRGDMTLRISPTTTTAGIKQIPKPIEFITNKNTYRRDGMITIYLHQLNTARKLFTELGIIQPSSPNTYCHS